MIRGELDLDTLTDIQSLGAGVRTLPPTCARLICQKATQRGLFRKVVLSRRFETRRVMRQAGTNTAQTCLADPPVRHPPLLKASPGQ